MGWFNAVRRRMWGGSFAGVVAFGCLTFLLMSSGERGERLFEFNFQIGCFVAALWALYAEWDEVRGQLGLASRALAERGLVLPWRWERVAGAWLSIALFFGFALVLAILALGRPNPNEPGWSTWLRWVVFAGAWTLPFYLECVLGLAGLSLLRYRLALRAIQPDLRPALAAVAPWTVAALCTPLLLFAGIGVPNPETARLVGNLALLALTPPPSAETVELLVELGPDDEVSELRLPLLLHGAEIERAFEDITAAEEPDLAATWLVRVPASNADALVAWLDRDDENVDSIELNSAIPRESLTLSTPCGGASFTGWSYDPLAGKQPELAKFWTADLLMGLARVTPRAPVLVAVIDTGIDGEHEDLQAVMVRAFNDDQLGHGTRVAGLIGATGRNGRGIVTPNLEGRFIRLRSYPAMAGRAPGLEGIVDALDRAMDDGARVINMSFGARGKPPENLLKAVRMAERRGVLLITSAGNDGAARDASGQWPANASGVLVVGALDRYGRPLPSSNTVNGVDQALWAPGEHLCTTNLDGGYTAVTGTSFSAALVSGLAATMWAICPRLTAAQLRQILADQNGALGGGAVLERDVFPWLYRQCN